jgi:hypothetical protein
MSVVFSNPRNSNSNGYFRIGNVILNIPPTNIVTDRIINNSRKTTLRGKNEMFTKSGQARWDVTITWTALKDSESYSQWSDLQTILAIFKAAPFVEVENSHVRQIISDKDPAIKTARMAFALRQLKVETHPDIVDGLVATLTMTYFNYNPYSLDFGYIGTKNQSVDANRSSLFNDYINAWKAKNLICHDNYWHIENWQDQITKENGKVVFDWKRYKAIPTKPKGDTSNQPYVPLNNPAANNLAVNIAVDQKSTQELTAHNLTLINTLNPAAKEAAISWLTQVAKGGPYKATITSARRRTTDDEPGIGESQTDLYNTFVAQGGTAALHKPGGPKYLVAKPGHSKHESGNALDITWSKNGAFDYALSIAGNYGFAWTYGLKDSVHWDYTGNKAPSTASPTPPVQSISKVDKNGEQVNQTLGDLTDIGPEVQKLLNEGWLFDYFTEDTIYLFKPEKVILRNKENQGKPHAKGLNPSQISVLFVNNLSQIPLAYYQFPTYQHIGPASSLISFQITSVGTPTWETGDPVHEGLSELTTMSNVLENQFMALQANFKKVDSIHGMQAVFVENPVLNMLGIFSILPEQLSTEIILDSANMVQVNLLAHQYENIFEETSAFKINGISGAYVKTLQKIITTNDSSSLTNLSKQEQGQLSNIIQFKKDMDANDPNALGGWIVNALSSELNGNFISQFNNNPFVSLSSVSAKNIASNYYTVGVSKSYTTLSGNTYPNMSSRASSVISSGKMTYADLLAFKAMGVIPSSETNNVNQVLATYKNNVSIISGLYSSVLVYVCNADPIFASQLQSLINSPAYGKQFSNSANPSGSNPGHGSYIDLGLDDGQNPSQYYYDYQAALRTKALDSLAIAVSTSTATTNQINSPGANIGYTTPSLGTAFPISAQGLSKLINIPSYSMKEAFPAFKIFFIEDANNGVFNCFDNFYSYSSILDIEVLRPYDKPATAVIRLTNIANLFAHKLYDHTTLGKYEAGLVSGYTRQATGGANTDGSTVQTATKNAITGQVTPSMDRTEGFKPGDPKLIPLKYFPLQTGSKIQIRMGFDNDPDKLTPVFNGLVTEIEEGEIGELMVTAQSFLLELATISPDGATPSNTWQSLTSLVTFGDDIGSAYGSNKLNPWSDGNTLGDTSSVIRSLLSNPAARHFGHWQLNTKDHDSLLKGYNVWIPLAQAASSLVGSSNISSALGSAYDRNGENIMVNSFIGASGETNPGRGLRSFNDEKTGFIGIGSVISKYQYFLDNTSTMSVWDLIRDVSRRYPENFILEKFYGFPYEADATMVFANPLDWYYYRPELIGDDEALKAADSSGQLYKEWYNVGGSKGPGKTQIQYAYDYTRTQQNYLDNGLLALDNLFRNTKAINLSTAASGLDGLNSVLGFIKSQNDLLTQNVLATTVSTAEGSNVDKVISDVQVDYQTYVSQQASSPGNPVTLGRLKPVRKYHYIDQQSIVKNSIKLNDKIYNAVKISDKSSSSYKVLKANPNIPDEHTRTLDISDLINDPAKNALENKLWPLYAASFIREEVGKIYRGELILRGNPEIEPMDVLVLNDASTSVIGPIEVEQVIHSFSQDMGYITIIKPRCLISINETVGISFMREMNLTINSIYKSAGININSAEALAFGIQVLTESVFYTILNNYANSYPIYIHPLSRYNKPWLGGLEGFSMTDLIGHFSNAFKEWQAYEIYPLIDAYKTANNIPE